LLSRDLAGKGSVGLVEDVLRCDLEALAKVLACEEEVEGWGCDDDLCVGVELGLIQVLNDVGDALNRAVP
jgi:hypothetical protein